MSPQLEEFKKIDKTVIKGVNGKAIACIMN